MRKISWLLVWLLVFEVNACVCSGQKVPLLLGGVGGEVRSLECRYVFSDSGELSCVAIPMAGDPLALYVETYLRREKKELPNKIELLIEATKSKPGEPPKVDQLQAKAELIEIIGEERLSDIVARYNLDIVRLIGFEGAFNFQALDMRGEPILDQASFRRLNWLTKLRDDYTQRSNEIHLQLVNEIEDELRNSIKTVPDLVLDSIAFSKSLKPLQEMELLQLKISPDNCAWLKDRDEVGVYLSACYLTVDDAGDNLKFVVREDIDDDEKKQIEGRLLEEKIRLLLNPDFSDFLELSSSQISEIQEMSDWLQARRKELWFDYVSSKFNPTPVTVADFELYSKQVGEFRKAFSRLLINSEKKVDQMLVSYQRVHLSALLIRREISKIGIIASLQYGSLSEYLDGELIALGKLKRISSKYQDKLAIELKNMQSRFQQAIGEEMDDHKSEDQDRLQCFQTLFDSGSLPGLLLNTRVSF